MIRVAFVLGTIASFVALRWSTRLLSSEPQWLGCLAVGAAAVIFVVMLLNTIRLGMRMDEDLSRAHMARARELLRHLETTREPLVIRMRGAVLAAAFGLFLTACGSGLLVLVTRYLDYVGLALGVTLVIAGLAILAPNARLLGKPALIIGLDHIEIAGYGVIPWIEIDGVHLLRDRRTQSMTFRVPRLALIRTHERFLERLTRSRSMQLVASVPIRWPSERAEVIEIVCKALWTECTGKVHVWSPTFSDEVNAAHAASIEAIRREAGPPTQPRSLVDHTLAYPERLAEMRRTSTSPEIAQLVETLQTRLKDSERTAQIASDKQISRIMWTLIVIIVLAAAGGAVALWLSDYSHPGVEAMP